MVTMLFEPPMLFWLQQTGWVAHCAALPAAAPRALRVMGLQSKPTEVTTFWMGMPTAPKRNAPVVELDW